MNTNAPASAPDRIELPGGFHLERRPDGTYALFGAGSDWQIGCIGIEAVREFAAAVSRPTDSELEAKNATLRDALLCLVDYYREGRDFSGHTSHPIHKAHLALGIVTPAARQALAGTRLPDLEVSGGKTREVA